MTRSSLVADQRLLHAVGSVAVEEAALLVAADEMFDHRREARGRAGPLPAHVASYGSAQVNPRHRFGPPSDDQD
jgi:hypothetical protein